VIPEQLYREILRKLPLVCVDIIVQSETGQYLLVRRRNEPLMNDYWVIGGRILHQEAAEDAARRKLKEEAGLAPEKLEFVGYYQDVFDRNSFEDGIAYHTLSLVFRTEIARDVRITLDSQSSDFIWTEALPPRFQINR
jgi:ADP-ribose pyrophosphatase YjhB (NUDIX family)